MVDFGKLISRVALAVVVALPTFLSGATAYAAQNPTVSGILAPKLTLNATANTSEGRAGEAATAFTYLSVAEVPEEQDVSALTPGQDYEPGQVIVGFRDTVESGSAAGVLENAVTVDSDAALSIAAESAGANSAERDDRGSSATAENRAETDGQESDANAAVDRAEIDGQESDVNAAVDRAARDDGEADEASSAGEPAATKLNDTTALVSVEPGATVAQAVNELSQNPEVAYAQPNFIYALADDVTNLRGRKVTSDAVDDHDAANDVAAGEESATGVVTVNDPGASEQWYLDDLGLYDAWALQKGSGSNVAVAVVDTGCDVDHPDLAANIAATYNSTDGSTDVTDTVGHGTNVCGVISAVANNGEGIAGVSYNAKLVPIKASTTGNTFTTASVVSAIKYATEERDTYGIRVINMSLAAASSSATESMEKAIYAAVDTATEQGLLVVCAAGNGGAGLSVPYASVPGDYIRCLSVMNLTSSHDLNSNSNYNVSGTSAKDLCAPGTSIYTCASRDLGQGSYRTTSGTSFAAPMVAGVAALCFAADPTLTAEECAEVLEQSATDLGDPGWDEHYGYGEINAQAAVSYALNGGNSVVVLRLYNPWTGEHLFTTSESEYSELAVAGWQQEGEAWQAVEWSKVPVLRLYNAWSGDHLYTVSLSEYEGLVAVGWQGEGEAFCSATNGSVEVDRLFNPYVTVGTHLYTTDVSEYASLATIGWRQEGVAFLAK